MNIASAKLALYAWWAKLNWQTTLAGFVAAAVVALQRTPGNTALHWQDLVAALFLALLGTFGVDPARLPSAATLAGAAESGNVVGLLLGWMRANWWTTVTGFAGAGMVVLQRVDDNAVHWQDVVAAVGFIALGVLAIDPARLPAVQQAPAVSAPPTSPTSP